MSTFVLWGARRYDVQIGGRLDRLLRAMRKPDSASRPVKIARCNRRAGW